MSGDPSFIPESIQLPLIIAAWIFLLLMILWDRHKLNRALRERPTLKIMNEKGDWVEVEESDIQPRVVVQHKPVSNFYDQDKDLKS